MAEASHLVLRSTQRSRSQRLSTGPNQRCPCSQRCTAGTERANAQAATIRNTVPGITGNTNPIRPSSSITLPSAA